MFGCSGLLDCYSHSFFLFHFFFFLSLFLLFHYYSFLLLFLFFFFLCFSCVFLFRILCCKRLNFTLWQWGCTTYELWGSPTKHWVGWKLTGRRGFAEFCLLQWGCTTSEPEVRQTITELNGGSWYDWKARFCWTFDSSEVLRPAGLRLGTQSLGWM
jgi:hypothetical protein